MNNLNILDTNNQKYELIYFVSILFVSICYPIIK